MTVFAFDRDWTVDVNPHPHHDAVPLEWVRYLAHVTDHHVYAIGNQDLADEAAIPGVVDIVGQHGDDWDQWLGAKQPDGRYERFPSRRERLALIEDLHPDADRYIVIDDLDLSGVAEWEHYHAWEFVPAVERGDIDVSIPDHDTEDLVCDGGLPTKAGLIPTSASHLASFLEEWADAPGYELTYADGGEERTLLCWDISEAGRSFERPAAQPAVECEPLAPGEETVTVNADNIEMLHVVRPPPKLYLDCADTATERAIGLRRLATVDADAVTVSAILTVIETGDDDATHAGVAALRQVARDRPEECTPAVPILRSLLDDKSGIGILNVVGTLRHIAEESPSDVAPLIEDLEPYLNHKRPSVRAEATRTVAAVGDADPADSVACVQALASVIEDRAPGTLHALHALACVSRDHPDAIEPVTETLRSYLTGDDIPDNAALNAISALGRFVGKNQGEGVEVVDAVAAHLDAENTKLRANAAGFVSDVSLVHTMAVRDHLVDLLPLLDDEDPYCRINASAAVSRLAEDFPDDVAPHIDRFVARLDDDNEIVRENACWGLGYLGPRAADTADDLERCLNDDEPDVRQRAQWALDEVTQ